MDVSEKRDEWIGETMEKRDHLDFATRITVHELYGTRGRDIALWVNATGQADFQK